MYSRRNGRKWNLIVACGVDNKNRPAIFWIAII